MIFFDSIDEFPTVVSEPGCILNNKSVYLYVYVIHMNALIICMDKE